MTLKMTRVVLSPQEKACLITHDSSQDSDSSIHYSRNSEPAPVAAPSRGDLGGLGGLRSVRAGDELQQLPAPTAEAAAGHQRHRGEFTQEDLLCSVEAMIVQSGASYLSQV